MTGWEVEIESYKIGIVKVTKESRGFWKKQPENIKIELHILTYSTKQTSYSDI